jgi:hypothetical protein
MNDQYLCLIKNFLFTSGIAIIVFRCVTHFNALFFIQQNGDHLIKI